MLVRKPSASESWTGRKKRLVTLVCNSPPTERVRILASTPFVRDLPVRLLSRGFHSGRLDEKQFR